MHPPAFIRKRMTWYYVRLYIYVRPERVFVWPGGDFSQEPTLYGARVDEVRTKHSVEPEVPLPQPEGGSAAWDERMDELGRHHRTAVLSLVGPDGFPLSSRVAIEPDRAAGARAAGRAARAGCRRTPRGPASRRTSTIPTSSGRPTSRCAGISCAKTVAGRWCRTSSSADSSSRSRSSQTVRKNFRSVLRYRKKAKAELAKRNK